MEYVSPHNSASFEESAFQYLNYGENWSGVIQRATSKRLERNNSIHQRRTQKRQKKSSPDHLNAIDESKSERTVEDFTKGYLTVPEAEQDEDADAEYAHLPESEKQILKAQVDIPESLVNFKQLFRYATRRDKIIIVVSIICSIAGGAALPLMNLIFGKVVGYFQAYFQETVSHDVFIGKINSFSLYFVYLAIGEFVTIYIATAGLIYTGDHITGAVRQQYLKALLCQNIAFFDSLGAGEITTRITNDSNLIQEAISEKFGQAMVGFSTFITVFVVGFFLFWKLTLICASVVVAIVLTMGTGSQFLIRFAKKSLALYGVGGSLAEEALGSIRIVVGFGLQHKLGEEYQSNLGKAFKWGFYAKVTLAFMVSSTFCFIYLSYGLAFWMGSRFLISGETDLAHILTIIMSIVIGSFSLGTVAINAEAFGTGVAAASKIYNVLDRKSPINPMSEAGQTLADVKGFVRFQRVKHIYPSRPDVTVTEDLNLYVPAGRTTALVGPSGSGKSTIIGLLLRFYDPVGGSVFLDGHDINDLNVRWLRSQIALVQQEPVLFATTIMENIAYGLIGSKYESESTQQREARIVNAAIMANAHNFICCFPDGYQTHVGERGLLLSGGQKQRIAIARAVVSDPKILLLDEATSALDSQSESVVQAALDVAALGRTTIVIAHRLSTIKNADNIVVMQKGRIVEQGNHMELLEQHGMYHSLVQTQTIQETPRSLQPAAYESEQLNRWTSKGTFQSSKQNSTPTGDISMDEYCHCEDDQTSQDCELNPSTNFVNGSTMQLPQPSGTEADERTYSFFRAVKFIGSFNKPDWMLMLLGLLFSILAGCGQPLQGILVSKAVEALAHPRNDAAEIRKDTDFWCLMYLTVGLLQWLWLVVENVSLAYCSEKLIHRARDYAFRTMLRQDIAYYDEKDHEVGALTSFLSTDITHLTGISGATLGTILSASTTLIASLTIALVIGWKLALVCMAALPVILICGFSRFWILARIQQRSQKAYSTSASYACESINAIRTVASLTREQSMWETYKVQINTNGKSSLLPNLRSTTFYAASEAAVFLAIALGFWYGGQLVAKGEYTLFQFFVCFSEMIFGVQSAGTTLSFAANMGKAKAAAQKFERLTDRPVNIDAMGTEGRNLKGDILGRIDFRNVHFTYPTRPGIPVLQNINLTIKPGQFAALVGGSGCGKSTLIQMIERFYDPTSGTVMLDGNNISRLRVEDYRSYIGLVSQEPTLYAGTIEENILLGADGLSVSEEDIIQASKDANIYEFVMSLPEGFGTNIGSRAVLLSGGQKQRVAIARALVRKPKILLLDEATSALDSESEKVVQAALDVAAKGRTTIAVVHRLSSIRNADVIYVLDQGAVLEAGTHDELMALRGRYRQMVIAQNLGVDS